MTRPRNSPDVLVAGGGPAGVAAALTLASRGADVVLVHSAPAAGRRVPESLSPLARPLLQGLGVLDRLPSECHAPCYGNQSSWGGPALTASDFLHGPYRTGWHVDRAPFDAALRRAARAAGVRLHAGGVRSVARHGGRWQATVSGTVMTAPYLVDATGARARLARRLGARVVHTDHLVAVAAEVPVAVPGHDGPYGARNGPERTSLVESTPFGWWYTAPLPCGRHVVMAVTDADLVAGAGLRTPQGWWAALAATRHVRARAAAHRTTAPHALRVLPAGTSRTLPPAGPGWVAAGDAAAVTDPVAARGITYALATGIAAATALTEEADGDPRAQGRYAALVGAVHDEFLSARATCYRAEERWDTPFWTRRRTPAGVTGRAPGATPGSSRRDTSTAPGTRREPAR
ncbi:MULTISPECIES: NAD(P)/FAD-dependent oxidoreductase [Streptomyces]|uniref:NAD(P)/FAD-dependent oxidoreductase n=1 Tax=Streptomyces TaxID=1883 RepID=UPI00068D5A05|nr:FAD-dependent oxidoreductase [Streptomyces durhamensis]